VFRKKGCSPPKGAGSQLPSNELRELRHRYKVAYTNYMQSVQALSDASQRGEWPDAEVLMLEEETLSELNVVRDALLAALREYCKRAGSVGY